MDQDLMARAIAIAQQYRNRLGCSLLKKEMHIGTCTANRILEEMEKRGLIEISYAPEYKVVVLM